MTSNSWHTDPETSPEEQTMSYRQQDPASIPRRYRSVRLHPYYRNKKRPTPEEARAAKRRSEQYRIWMREAREELAAKREEAND